MQLIVLGVCICVYVSECVFLMCVGGGQADLGAGRSSDLKERCPGGKPQSLGFGTGYLGTVSFPSLGSLFHKICICKHLSRGGIL